MKFHKQLFKHEPEKGVFGDCFRTSIGCLLDLEPGEVPHFYAEPGATRESVEDHIQGFLENRGMRLIDVPYMMGQKMKPEEFLASVLAKMYPNIPVLFSGTSRTGCNHTVIAYNDAILHDPSLTGAGIIGPCDDGHYWIGFMAVALDGPADGEVVRKVGDGAK